MLLVERIRYVGMATLCALVSVACFPIGSPTGTLPTRSELTVLVVNEMHDPVRVALEHSTTYGRQAEFTVNGGLAASLGSGATGSSIAIYAPASCALLYSTVLPDRYYGDPTFVVHDSGNVELQSRTGAGSIGKELRPAEMLCAGPG